MTTAQSPLSPERALTLLRRGVDEDPGAMARERVAARLEHSIAAGLAPVAASTTALVQLAASQKLMLGLTLIVGVVIGAGADHIMMTKASKPSAEVATAVASRPVALAVPTPVDPIQPADSMPIVRAEDLPRLAITKSQAHEAPAPSSAQVSLTPATGEHESQPDAHTASLREQQALLDQARLALGRGQFERCMASIDLHRSRYPQSLLAEEREALTIKALAASGDLPVARDRLVTFRANHPRSLLLESLQVTVDKIR